MQYAPIAQYCPAMQETRRRWSLVDHPNVLMKIPGTSAGVPAIEQLRYEGVTMQELVYQHVNTAQEKTRDRGDVMDGSSLCSPAFQRVHIHRRHRFVSRD